MKKIFVFIAVFCFNLNLILAQKSMRPLTGNGKNKSLNYPIKAFDMLEILWIDGDIEVEYGAAQSDISFDTDENIYNALLVENTEGSLKLEFKNNYQNRLWVEDDKTKIKIRTTMQPRKIIYKSNANIAIKGINTSLLSIVKDENGDMELAGIVKNLMIENDDNGNINAQNLIAEQASVSVSGNGNVSVNAKKITNQKVGLWSNGGVLNKAYDEDKTANARFQTINITFNNPENRSKEYKIVGTNEYGRRFSYGISLRAMDKKTERLPIGTMIYFKGKLIATLTQDNDNQVVKL